MKKMLRRLIGATAAYVIFNIVASALIPDQALVKIVFVFSSTMYLFLVLWEAMESTRRPPTSVSYPIHGESEYDRLVRLVNESTGVFAKTALEELSDRVRRAYINRISIRHSLTPDEVNGILHDRGNLTQTVSGETLRSLISQSVKAEDLTLKTVSKAIEEIEAEAR